MSKPKIEFDNNEYLKKALDNLWFKTGIVEQTFPGFEAKYLIGTDEEKIGLFCIGGTQAVKVAVKEFKPIMDENNIGYVATVIIQYLDTFGVSEADYTKDLAYKMDVVNNFKYNYRGGVLAHAPARILSCGSMYVKA
ncbi:hypothetical protein [Flavobacterium collinsii]|uniref:Uncharacterized protein n=1 Tax=Flavobacterium collinsii TaxID=1114861 RepID=A0ABM8KPF6_9FLAO|nr:hypothetical protein [Flavobacterium collinsii]CAA9202687.1 hypothetical protein FLACOL7796_04401 [Flavobacterium collinsii]